MDEKAAVGLKLEGSLEGDSAPPLQALVSGPYTLYGGPYTRPPPMSLLGTH